MYKRLRLPTAAALALLASTALAAEDYRTIDGPTPGDDPDTVEVMEFFWYGCPHCNRFAPLIEEWKSRDHPDDVAFRHVPAVLSASWEVHARAFYAAKVMGVLERFHRPMFDAIHEQGRPLESAAAIGEFASSLGIDGERFAETMQSFAVDTNVRQARSLQRAYGVSGTPSVVIDGRYVTSPGEAGSFERMIEIINERVAALRGDSG